MKIADILREFNENQEPSDDFWAALAMWVRDHIYKMSDEDKKEIDTGFRQEMKPLNEKLTVYRGMMFDSWDKIGKGLDFRNDDNKTISFGNYISTTLFYDVALDHLTYRTDAGVYVMFEIETLPSAPALRLADYGEYIMDLDGFVDEDVDFEIVLHAGAKFKIVDKQKIEVEWEPGGFYQNPDAEHWRVNLKQVA